MNAAPSSSSSDSDHHDHHGHDGRQGRAGYAVPSVPGVTEAIVGQQGNRNFTSSYNQAMSGPEFPSHPPPYSSEGNNQQFVTIPNPESHGSGFAPPPGPPPNFPSAQSPGFPSPEGQREGLGTPEFPKSPQDAPSFPRAPLTVGATTENREATAFAQRTQSAPPPSGFRLPLTATGQFPTNQAGQPVANDLDGSPVFVGSALMERSVHPCKIVPNLQPPCRVPYGGGEFEHRGRFDLLPFDPMTMEWVHTSQGRIPTGRRPVEGGYEEHGGKLYHALGTVNGVKVPGKTGEHLVRLSLSHDILTWC